MVWPELDYEPELYLPDGTKWETADSAGSRQAVQFNHDLFNHYKKLIHIRSESPALQVGDFETLLADEDIFAFRRSYEDEPIIVILNRGTAVQTVTVPQVDQSSFVDLLNDHKQYQVSDGPLILNIPTQWGAILRNVTS